MCSECYLVFVKQYKCFSEWSVRLSVSPPDSPTHVAPPLTRQWPDKTALKIVQKEFLVTRGKLMEI